MVIVTVNCTIAEVLVTFIVEQHTIIVSIVKIHLLLILLLMQIQILLLHNMQMLITVITIKIPIETHTCIVLIVTTIDVIMGITVTRHPRMVRVQ